MVDDTDSLAKQEEWGQLGWYPMGEQLWSIHAIAHGLRILLHKPKAPGESRGKERAARRRSLQFPDANEGHVSTDLEDNTRCISPSSLRRALGSRWPTAWPSWRAATIDDVQALGISITAAMSDPTKEDLALTDKEDPRVKKYRGLRIKQRRSTW